MKKVHISFGDQKYKKSLDLLEKSSLEIGDVDAIIGGPPCQFFSISNVNKKDNDIRRRLPSKYASIVKGLNKRYNIDFFLFENVAGITTKRHQEDLNLLKDYFKEELA